MGLVGSTKVMSAIPQGVSTWPDSVGSQSEVAS